MKSVIVITMGLLVMIGSPAARSRTQPGTFLVIGAAARSCGQYLGAVEGERRSRPAYGVADGVVFTADYGEYVDFVDGYLTGANLTDVPARRSVGEHTDHMGRMAWLENYCRANPLSAFIDAVTALRAYLIAQGK
jgi:hypothetical protein